MSFHELPAQHYADLEVGIRPGQSKTAIVFLHGYGANRHDLASLAEVLDPAKKHNWFFPNGFLKIPMSPFYDSRGWAPIDFQGYEQAIRTNQFHEYLNQKAQGLEPASKKLAAFLKELSQDHPDMILGGFSQGAMLTLDLALSLDLNFQSVITFSNAFVAEKRWTELLQNKKKRLKIFQSHGTLDPILPFDNAKFLFETLVKFKQDATFHEFQGAHEIPQSVITHVKSWLGFE